MRHKRKYLDVLHLMSFFYWLCLIVLILGVIINLFWWQLAVYVYWLSGGLFFGGTFIAMLCGSTDDPPMIKLRIFELRNE